MQKLQKNISLKPYNTFRIEAKTDYLFEFSQPAELLTFLEGNSKELKRAKLFVLGGGSNVLFTHDFHGVIIHPQMKGYHILQETDSYVDIKVGAGEVWDDFVAFAIKRGLGGVENLSWIPGNVGAAPVQNIGAYGVEAKETILRVEAIDLFKQKPVVFNNEECHFTYRNSIFKQDLIDKLAIVNVIFRLNKHPQFNLSYQGLEKELQQHSGINLEHIREAVISIRKRKLPDTEQLGNAGSFFKNPLISRREAYKLQQKYPEMPMHNAGSNEVKLSAGWMIEKTGYKGVRHHDTGTYEKQALVIVNYGHANTKNIKYLAQEIQQQVYNTFGIYLEPEVRTL